MTPVVGTQPSYQFSWGSHGQLVTQPVFLGPGETLILPYDTILKQHQDERDYATDGLLETEIHFLDVRRQVKDRIDLLPALQAAGIPCTTKDRLLLRVLPSPDGRYLYLQGQGNPAPTSGEVATIKYTVHGVVDLTTKQVRFLPFSRGDDRFSFYWLENGYRWIDSQVLLTPGISSDMALLDVKTMQLTPITLGQEVITGLCTTDGVAYVTHTEVGRYKLNGEREVLLWAGNGEELIAATVSPDGTSMAVTMECRGDGGPVRFVHVFPLK